MTAYKKSYKEGINRWMREIDTGHLQNERSGIYYRKDSRVKGDAMPTAVYLVEDHPLLQHILSEFIMNLADLTVCGVATYGAEALLHLPKLRPDLVLVDLSLPDISGFRIVDELTATYPEVPTLILSTYYNPIYVQRALACGARGYIVKGNPLEIEEAIRHVLAGQIYLSPQLVN